MIRIVIRVCWCALFCLVAAGSAWADGAVYAMTNALGNNQILVYHRASDGTLLLVQTIATGGGGSGLQLAGVDSLGSSGSLQLDEAHHLLFVVNTESFSANNGAGAYNTDCQQGTITSFVIASDGTLTFADRVFSRGLFPNSLAEKTILVPPPPDEDDNGKGKNKGDTDDTPQPLELLYALNAGGPEAPICNLTPVTANIPNITGFRVDNSGHMIPLGSTEPIDPGPATGPAGGVSCTAATETGFANLTGAPAADFQCGLNPPSFPQSPAQVGFTPSGSQLVITVKGTNSIYVFPVNSDGTVGSPTITQAPGPALPTFFGFSFDASGHLLVAELFGTSTSIPRGGAGALSSFTITSDGHLQPISSDVADGGTAASFIAVEPITGRFAYLANNLSASISSYTVGNNGVVTLLNGAAATASGPNTLAVASEGSNSWLYAVAAGTGTVLAFHINGDGSLTAITGGTGLPTNSAQGIAAY